MEYSSINKVKFWIAEHALKHNFVAVIKEIIKDEDIANINDDNVSNINGILKLVSREDSSLLAALPTFLLVFMMKACVKAFVVNRENHDYNNKRIKVISKNPKLFGDINCVLKCAYKQFNFVTCKKYIELDVRLKLVELLFMISNGESNESVINRLNVILPTKSTLEGLLNDLHVAGDAGSLKKYVTGYIESRTHILQLLLTPERKQNYLSTSYSHDIIKFISCIVKIFDNILNIMEPKLPLTAIETIINGEEINLSSSYDPCVQLLIDHLRPNMEENDFIDLLKLLNVGDTLPSFSTCFETIDFSSSDID